MIEIGPKAELTEILRSLFQLLHLFELAKSHWKDSHMDALNRYCRIGFGIDKDEPLFLYQ